MESRAAVRTEQRTPGPHMLLSCSPVPPQLLGIGKQLRGEQQVAEVIGFKKEEKRNHKNGYS